MLSLDAYRGFIMLMMASAGFGLAEIGKAHPGTGWEIAGRMVGHVEWVGCAPWDLIQPAFMFMAGMAVPLSYWRRKEEGQRWFQMAAHALTRAVLLVLLGVMLATRSGDVMTQWLFTNVLAQIGLGYFLLFVLWRLGPEYEVSAIIVILTGYWLYFYLHPLATTEGLEALAVKKEAMMSGLMAHWNPHTNAAAAFDRWFLNLFPRVAPFETHPGGYQTLNFVPSLATMLGGSLTCRFLTRSPKSDGLKAGLILAAGIFCLFAGTMAGLFVCPVVKRIWTPSWVLFSGGWVLILLAGFHWLTEVRGWKRLVFPLVVVGTNSLFVYMISQLGSGWIRGALKTHLPDAWFSGFYGPTVQSVGVLAVIWLLCYWLFRQRAFLKL